MRYQRGCLGRVFIAKIGHGEDVLQEIKAMALKERIRSGCLLVLGALKQGSLVAGPEEAVIPPKPKWLHFGDARELLAAGTLFWNEKEPVIHLHASIGKGEKAVTGCLRKKSETYLIIEVILLEILGVNARRMLDPRYGVEVLKLLSNEE